MVQCTLCPRNCEVKDGYRATAGPGKSQGRLLHPCLRQPLRRPRGPGGEEAFFHVLPGSRSFSIATAGCNLHCKFWAKTGRSPRPRPEKTLNFDLPPEKVVAGAQEAGCLSWPTPTSRAIIFMSTCLRWAAWPRRRAAEHLPLRRLLNHPTPGEAVRGAGRGLHRSQGLRSQVLPGKVDGKLAPVLDTLKTLRRRGCTWRSST